MDPIKARAAFKGKGNEREISGCDFIERIEVLLSS